MKLIDVTLINPNSCDDCDCECNQRGCRDGGFEDGVKAVIKWLNEPCENWQHRTPIASEYKVIQHRYMCSECRGEAGLE